MIELDGRLVTSKPHAMAKKAGPSSGRPAHCPETNVIERVTSLLLR